MLACHTSLHSLATPFSFDATSIERALDSSFTYYVRVRAYTPRSNALGWSSFGRIQRHKNILKQRKVLLVPRNATRLSSLFTPFFRRQSDEMPLARPTFKLCLQISMVDHIKPRRLHHFLFDSPASLSPFPVRPQATLSMSLSLSCVKPVRNCLSVRYTT